MADLTSADVLAGLITMLRPDVVDDERAQLAVDLAMERASAVISPLPSAARPILIDVALRGYSNPHGLESRTTGPFTERFRAPGVYLLDQERADLLSLGSPTTSTGGAFTIRPGGVAPPPVYDAPRPF